MKNLIIFFTCLAASLSASDIPWDYSSGPYGRTFWGDHVPQCRGAAQSPVAIHSGCAVKDSDLTPIQFEGYDTRLRGMTLVNNGHAAQVNLGSGDAIISGGGLEGEYKAGQFHFHWGSVGTQGSEHTLDGRSFPLELHIVHYATRFPSLTKAAENADGIAVLSFFFELSTSDNVALNPIVTQLANVRSKDQTSSMPPMTLDSFLPTDRRDYYRYSGSLTTPECNEVVVWTIFQRSISISLKQIEVFRTLEGNPNESISDNFRPLQLLNKRTIYVVGNDASAIFRPLHVLSIAMGIVAGEALQ